MEPQPKVQVGVTDNQRTHPLHEESTTILSVPSKQTQGRRSLWSVPLAFLLGILVTLVVLFLSFLLLSPDRSVSGVPQLPMNNAITAQISHDYLTQVVQKELKTSGLPGSISNVQVALGQDNLVTISGDDEISVLGLGVTKHFTLVVQLSVSSCQLHARVTHADLAGIPVTGYAATFENEMNQQLQTQSTGLPSGFTYCITGVQTETNQLVLTYSATTTS